MNAQGLGSPLLPSCADTEGSDASIDGRCLDTVDETEFNSLQDIKRLTGKNGPEISVSSMTYFPPEAIPANSGYLTCFLLLNTMIGSGILNQPYVFYESGVVGGVIGFILSAVLTWIGLLILTDSGIKLGVYNYSACCLSILGPRGEKAVD